MTPREIQLIRSSIAQVAPFADHAVALFFARLFELEPALRGRLPDELAVQGGRVVALLGVWVEALDRPAASAPAGPRPAPHAASVGAALLWTLERVLGPRFTPEIRAAWAGAARPLAEALAAVPQPGPSRTA
jgi:hemoglobin-like flavoprotein